MRAIRYGRKTCQEDYRELFLVVRRRCARSLFSVHRRSTMNHIFYPLAWIGAPNESSNWMSVNLLIKVCFFISLSSPSFSPLMKLIKQGYFTQSHTIGSITIKEWRLIPVKRNKCITEKKTGTQHKQHRSIPIERLKRKHEDQFRLETENTSKSRQTNTNRQSENRRSDKAENKTLIKDQKQKKQSV